MSTPKLLNQTTGQYMADDDVIRMALAILQHRFTLKRPSVNSPQAVRDYLHLTLADRQHEVFACVFLDAQHRVIALEEMFRGTLTQASVYPREVVKAALALNACSVIFAHNHPSGVATASRADELLTQALKQALQLVDIRVLDHIIVAGSETVSFDEKGIL